MLLFFSKQKSSNLKIKSKLKKTFYVIFTRVCSEKGFEKTDLQFYRVSSAEVATRFAKDRDKRFMETWSSQTMKNFICFNKSLLKIMKNVFYLILKALSSLKIF